MTIYKILTEVASFAWLQGSRAHFDNVSAHTDWDFYCASNERNEILLKTLGFVLCNKESYMDDNTVAVYKYKAAIAIDVAIVKDIALKDRVESWVEDHVWILQVPEKDRPLIYNMIMNYLKEEE